MKNNIKAYKTQHNLFAYIWPVFRPVYHILITEKENKQLFLFKNISTKDIMSLIFTNTKTYGHIGKL